MTWMKNTNMTITNEIPKRLIYHYQEWFIPIIKKIIQHFLYKNNSKEF